MGLAKTSQSSAAYMYTSQVSVVCLLATSNSQSLVVMLVVLPVPTLFGNFVQQIKEQKSLPCVIPHCMNGCLWNAWLSLLTSIKRSFCFHNGTVQRPSWYHTHTSQWAGDLAGTILKKGVCQTVHKYVGDN